MATLAARVRNVSGKQSRRITLCPKRRVKDVLEERQEKERKKKKEKNGDHRRGVGRSFLMNPNPNYNLILVGQPASLAARRLQWAAKRVPSVTSSYQSRPSYPATSVASQLFGIFAELTGPSLF